MTKKDWTEKEGKENYRIINEIIPKSHPYHRLDNILVEIRTWWKKGELSRLLIDNYDVNESEKLKPIKEKILKIMNNCKRSRKNMGKIYFCIKVQKRDGYFCLNFIIDDPAMKSLIHLIK